MKPSKSHHVFQCNDLWWQFYQRHQADLRPVEVDNIIKMLACGTSDMGGRTYRCSCPDCPHVKHIAFSCFPPALQSSGQTHKRWNKYLNLQYQRFWHVYLVKPTDNAAHTVNYLSPPRGFLLLPAALQSAGNHLQL